MGSAIHIARQHLCFFFQWCAYLGKMSLRLLSCCQCQTYRRNCLMAKHLLGKVSPQAFVTHLPRFIHSPSSKCLRLFLFVRKVLGKVMLYYSKHHEKEPCSKTQLPLTFFQVSNRLIGYLRQTVNYAMSFNTFALYAPFHQMK